MTDAPHPWKPGDEVWLRYYDMATSGYVGRLAGHVVGVGRIGIKFRRLKPDHEGKMIAKHGYWDVWPSKEAIDAEIALRPTPDVPRGPGA